MQIRYYTSFSKRKNSTKRPTGGTTVDVNLKNPCSILAPVFETAIIPDNVNYIEAFGNYYFVSDVTHITNDMIRIECSIDAMATAKTQIGNTRAYVEYTSSSSSTKITDPRNRPTIEILESATDIFDLTDYGFLTSLSTGFYIVGVACDNGVVYLEMTETELRQMLAFIYSDSFTQQLQSQFYDLKNIITSCIKIPYTKTMRTAIPGGLFVNGISIMTTAYEAAPRVLHPIGGLTCSFAMPDPAGDGQYSYLNQAPYSTGMIYLPYVGVVPLDLDIFAENEQFKLDMYFDECTGDIVYRISNTTGDYVSTYSGNCATNIPISGSSYNAIGAIGAGITAIGSLGSIAAGAVSMNPALAISGTAGLVSSGASAFESLRAHTQVNGSISSALGCAVGSVGKVVVFTKTPTETDLDSFKPISGMPYFKCAQISSLSGYVQCAGASVDIPGLDSVRETVNSYLNSGFFYE